MYSYIYILHIIIYIILFIYIYNDGWVPLEDPGVEWWRRGGPTRHVSSRAQSEDGRHGRAKTQTADDTRMCAVHFFTRTIRRRTM